MADLHKAEAAARESERRYLSVPSSNERAHEAAAALSHLLAALDAARGEAVAWHSPRVASFSFHDSFSPVWPRSDGWYPVYAAPPAALAVSAEPIGWVFQHEDTGRMTFCENDGITTPEAFQRLNPRHVLCGPAYTQAQQPAALAVPDDAKEHVAEVERLRRELASAQHCRAEEYRQREAWRAKAGRLEEVLGQIAKRPQPEKYTDWTAWHTWAVAVQELAEAWGPEDDNG